MPGFLFLLRTMNRTAPIIPIREESLPLADQSNASLLRELLVLSLPVFAEHALHILVGMNDTYLANHIHLYHAATDATRADETAAGAAVGTMAYILWFVGLMVSAVGTGSTAIIARAIGAKHRRLANSICGQSISCAIIVGCVVGACMFFFAGPIADATGLEPSAHAYALSYLKILAIALPFSTVMFVANSCLRGAGDTLTPAITMIVVDIINMAFSWGMTFGWLGLPKLGFNGIAWGTSIAYVAGGVIQFYVLLSGRGGIRLFLHRMQPHWHNLKRLLRIGLPGGAADMLHFLANFGIVILVNQLGDASGNAHAIAIRVEALSYMMGFAVATAVATMVGQSLGMKKPQRAQRCAYLAYAVGGGFMTFAGVGLILFGKYAAMLFSDDPAVRALTTQCLFITGFIQCGFAAALIFGGALRGAGDTMMVMFLSAFSVFVFRLGGAIIVVRYFHFGLEGVWLVLCGELMIRGSLIFGRLVQGGWKKIAV
ncbi:MAG TPA: MATE family efflux transporter [Tepidisphaeraceae bacterium]